MVSPKPAPPSTTHFSKSKVAAKSCPHPRWSSRLIIPAGIFFAIYSLAIPEWINSLGMQGDRHFGPFGAAYLFRLSQFFMAWSIAALYVRATGIFGLLSRPSADSAGAEDWN